MSLRTKLMLMLFGGSAVFLAATAVIRGALESRSSSMQHSLSADIACEDAQFEIQRRRDGLVARLTSRLTQAAATVEESTAPGDRNVQVFWTTLVEAVAPGADETLVLVSPGGEVHAADGPLAADVPSLSDGLRSRGVTGRGGPSGPRTSVLSAGELPLVAASVTAPESMTAHAELVGAVPGTALRVVLVETIDLLRTAERVPSSSITLYNLKDEELPEELRGLASDLWRAGGVERSVLPSGARVVRAIDDAVGRPSFLIVVDAVSENPGLLPPKVREALVWEFLMAALAIMLALRFLDARVLRPVEAIQARATRLARTEHGTLAFHTNETGEFGELVGALDQMLAKIQSDRSEFVRSARIAGMSDVSMGVVHSAGNILNSVNVSTKLLSKEIGAIGVEDLRAMITELEKHKDDLGRYVSEDPNGQFFIPFLLAMTETLDDMRARCIVELESVEHGVAHVIDLIRSQEKYAIGASVVEETNIGDVIDMAVNVAMLANERSSEIVVDRSYDQLRDVHVDRHKLTSILINIVSNAIEALLAEGVEERRLELSVYPMTDDLFVVEVTDSGIGIASEHLDLIFNASFSTKEDSSGQGLHTTANLCKELGIAIGAVSDGVGLGTTLKLRVPYMPPRAAEVVGELDGLPAALPAGALAPDPGHLSRGV